MILFVKEMFSFMKQCPKYFTLETKKACFKHVLKFCPKLSFVVAYDNLTEQKEVY